VLTKSLMLLAILGSACAQDVTLNDDGGGGGGDDTGGGGGGVDPFDIAKSGSRIKMKVLASGDGAKFQQGWVDSQRNNEDCNWQVASDGMTRCLPTSVAYSSGYFADASCTQPVGYAAKGCTAPAYISVFPATSCTTTGPSIYVRGAAVSTAYVKSGTTCTATQLGLTYDLWAAGAAVAATSFQSATVTTE
jgi:hypothetical protein